MSSAREIAIDATDILNDLIGDYVAATNTLRDYYKKVGSDHTYSLLNPAISAFPQPFRNTVLAYVPGIVAGQFFHHLVQHAPAGEGLAAGDAAEGFVLVQ